ncbi:MAG: hypothetical protein WKF57_19085 [Nakamurella sp.]
MEPTTTDPMPRLAELRRQAAGLGTVGDPPVLTPWLRELVETLADLGAGPALLAALDLANAYPSQPDVLQRAAFECNTACASDLALPLVALADRLRPRDPDIVIELAHTLNGLGRHYQARELGRYDSTLVELPGLITEHLVAATAAGDLPDLAELTPKLIHPDWFDVRRTYDALLMRANALQRNGFPLTDDDLRGWQATLTSTMVLQTANRDMEGMNGRYAALWLSQGQFAAAIDALIDVVHQSARTLSGVVAGPSRDDEIVALALAARLDVDVVQDRAVSRPYEPVLYASWQWSPSAAWCSALQDEHSRVEAVSFAVWADWTGRVPVGPDVVAVLAQSVFSPWGARMVALPDVDDPNSMGRIQHIPPDTRNPELVAAEAALWLADPSHHDSRTISSMVTALGEVLPVVGWWGGRREQFGGVHPVNSSRFI